MAVWVNWSDAQRKLWDLWMEDRPDVIKEAAKKYDLRPDRLYRLKTTNQRVVLVALAEDGTVRIAVLAQFNMHVFPGLQEREVFGINPADLEECDYPTADEVTAGCWKPVAQGDPDVSPEDLKNIPQSEHSVECQMEHHEHPPRYLH